MPFHHPDRSHGLGTRIEMEVRERLEEAIDYVCLERLVRQRRARGLPAPVADSDADRAEYHATVRALLIRLAADVRDDAPDDAVAGSGDDEAAGLLAAQVRLARALPDYWQRFEAISTRFIADASRDGAAEAPSGRDRRGLLARLFDRG